MKKQYNPVLATLIILFLLSGSCTHKPEYVLTTVTGRVVDSGDGRSQSGVRVSISNKISNQYSGWYHEEVAHTNSDSFGNYNITFLMDVSKDYYVNAFFDEWYIKSAENGGVGLFDKPSFPIEKFKKDQKYNLSYNSVYMVNLHLKSDSINPLNVEFCLNNFDNCIGCVDCFWGNKIDTVITFIQPYSYYNIIETPNGRQMKVEYSILNSKHYSNSSNDFFYMPIRKNSILAHEFFY